MNDSELKRFIRDQIAQQLNVILFGEAGDNTVENETIDNLYPGMPSIESRPVMHPAGFASRATPKTIQVVAKVGSGPQNRMVIGHRDKNRPKDIELGESSVYSWDDSGPLYELRSMIDGIRLIKGDKKIALLLGDDVLTSLGKLVDLIANHVHGPPGSLPSNKALFDQYKQTDLDGTTLLSTKDGGFT